MSLPNTTQFDTLTLSQLIQFLDGDARELTITWPASANQGRIIILIQPNGDNNNFLPGDQTFFDTPFSFATNEPLIQTNDDNVIINSVPYIPNQAGSYKCIIPSMLYSAVLQSTNIGVTGFYTRIQSQDSKNNTIAIQQVITSLNQLATSCNGMINNVNTTNNSIAGTITSLSEALVALKKDTTSNKNLAIGGSVASFIAAKTI